MFLLVATHMVCIWKCKNFDFAAHILKIIKPQRKSPLFRVTRPTDILIADCSRSTYTGTHRDIDSNSDTTQSEG